MGALTKQILKDLKKAYSGHSCLFNRPRKDQGTRAADDFNFKGLAISMDHKRKGRKGSPYAYQIKHPDRIRKQPIYERCTKMQEVAEK